MTCANQNRNIGFKVRDLDEEMEPLDPRKADVDSHTGGGFSGDKDYRNFEFGRGGAKLRFVCVCVSSSGRE